MLLSLHFQIILKQIRSSFRVSITFSGRSYVVQRSRDTPLGNLTMFMPSLFGYRVSFVSATPSSRCYDRRRRFATSFSGEINRKLGTNASTGKPHRIRANRGESLAVYLSDCASGLCTTVVIRPNTFHT